MIADDYKRGYLDGLRDGISRVGKPDLAAEVRGIFPPHCTCFRYQNSFSTFVKDGSGDTFKSWARDPNPACPVHSPWDVQCR